LNIPNTQGKALGRFKMIEIRFHGRGGQGAVIGANLLAEAAFREGKDVQAFPFFGVERRGAPVTAYTKIDDKPIRIKSQIYEPDYVVVLDPSLVGYIDIAEGLKPGGRILVNTTRSPEDLKKVLGDNVSTVDANGIAISHKLGSRTAPIVNTAILGAFARLTEIVKIESLVDAILETAPMKQEENAKAAKEAFEAVKI
jgi:2-oxoacid:acceptor oxidoreductase gamma subunit (pyruvate/2-ketoisovalerate family)